MSNHEEALERDWRTLYVLGELAEPERSRFEEHFFDCPDCADAVKRSYLLLRGAESTLKRSIFAAAPQTAVPAPKPRNPRTALSWSLRALPYAAMVCLSVAAGFQYVALERARSPQTLVSFDIAPQAKGEAEKITLPETGGFVELELDLLQPAPLYHWEIKSAGAARALTGGEVRPPANTLVLKLLVSADKLHPGRYEAAIAVPSGQRTVYPFEVIAAPSRKSTP